MIRICSVIGFATIALFLCGCGSTDSSAFQSTRLNAWQQPEAQFNTEEYDDIEENDFVDAMTQPLSTFAVDVDTASYSNVRRMLTDGQLPPKGAVRIEELVNYFEYDYPQPSDDHPFSVSTIVAPCPWNQENRLLRIALQGKQIQMDDRPASNLVFLLDVSGSMSAPNKLPLVKSAMKMLVEQLTENDRIAIVVYAGASGRVLNSTSADQKAVIMNALDNLQAGGSTNGGEGVKLAYQIALENFIAGGTNRVILCTDGDFNVGTTNRSELVDLIQEKAQEGTFLSVFGFGTGNLKDSTMEQLADKGNGNYAYIDSKLEARRALVDQLGGTLITIAKDVKIQVDFNPAQVQSYRLIGYENRVMANQDFRDDRKDAGEIGAGHRVTALYELVPVGSEDRTAPNIDSEFVEVTPRDSVDPEKMLVVRLRYKQPAAEKAMEFSTFLTGNLQAQPPMADSDMTFASAVATFGMLLRESEHAGQANWDSVIKLASAGTVEDQGGFRAEFVDLARKAKELSAEKP